MLKNIYKQSKVRKNKFLQRKISDFWVQFSVVEQIKVCFTGWVGSIPQRPWNTNSLPGLWADFCWFRQISADIGRFRPISRFIASEHFGRYRLISVSSRFIAFHRVSSRFIALHRASMKHDETRWNAMKRDGRPISAISTDTKKARWNAICEYRPISDYIPAGIGGPRIDGVKK